MNFTDKLIANLKLLPHTATLWVSVVVTSILAPLVATVPAEQWTAWLTAMHIPPWLAAIIVGWLIKDLPTLIARVWPQPDLTAKEAAVTGTVDKQ